MVIFIGRYFNRIYFVIVAEEIQVTKKFMFYVHVLLKNREAFLSKLIIA